MLLLTIFGGNVFSCPYLCLFPMLHAPHIPSSVLRNCPSDKLVVMVGDEGETDTHCMGWAAIIIRALGPYFFCSGENELTFSGFKHEAEIIK